MCGTPLLIPYLAALTCSLLHPRVPLLVQMLAAIWESAEVIAQVQDCAQATNESSGGALAGRRNRIRGRGELKHDPLGDGEEKASAYRATFLGADAGDAMLPLPSAGSASSVATSTRGGELARTMTDIC